MREISFRAWNKEEKFLDTAWSIDFEHRLVCHRAHNQSDLDDCVLMQYTGLKDKNGRKIYEGDIVNHFYRYYVGMDEVSEEMEVVEIKDLTHLPFDLSTIGCEIIGNIYENPELLEVKGNE